MIKLKRVYTAPDKADGLRVLVERLWPRGLSKERARVDVWLKDIAPSPELRVWYSHDLAKWEEFQNRYFDELKSKTDVTGLLKQKAKEGTVTFVFAASDEQHNSALVLKTFIEAMV
ncbi:MAG: DUF488 domain-containing protein [Dehalococcoidales bacterium]